MLIAWAVMGDLEVVVSWMWCAQEAKKMGPREGKLLFSFHRLDADPFNSTPQHRSRCEHEVARAVDTGLRYRYFDGGSSGLWRILGQGFSGPITVPKAVTKTVLVSWNSGAS